MEVKTASRLEDDLASAHHESADKRLLTSWQTTPSSQQTWFRSTPILFNQDGMKQKLMSEKALENPRVAPDSSGCIRRLSHVPAAAWAHHSANCELPKGRDWLHPGCVSSPSWPVHPYSPIRSYLKGHLLQESFPGNPHNLYRTRFSV